MCQAITAHVHRDFVCPVWEEISRGHESQLHVLQILTSTLGFYGSSSYLGCDLGFAEWPDGWLNLPPLTFHLGNGSKILLHSLT